MTNDHSLLWLRAETKPSEQRTLLTPEVAGQLVANGYEIVVERSAQRIFNDRAYVDAGCKLVDSHAWQQAPLNAIVLGLKELRLEDGPFSRRHVHFAHIFKDQYGWQDMLQQFNKGNGLLYDLEYLVDESGRRIAAFGYWAGFVGAAVAILAYCAKTQGVSLAPLSAWLDRDQLVDTVQNELNKLAVEPTALVIGALGRCGCGAIDLCTRCDVKTTAWDQAQTEIGGPFDAVRDHDMLINCVFVKSTTPPFTTLDHLRKPSRRLQVISDVSCDPSSQYNPLPVYTQCTSMQQPVFELLAANGEQKSLELVAIDHLPSLLPRESSEDFSGQLASTLLTIKNLDKGAWQRARQVFDHHMNRLSQKGNKYEC